MAMEKEIVEQKEKPEEGKSDGKNEAKGSCGCGCVPPVKTK